MQYELQIFETEDRGEFRTVNIDGEPWFVFADVCRALALLWQIRIVSTR